MSRESARGEQHLVSAAAQWLIYEESMLSFPSELRYRCLQYLPKSGITPALLMSARAKFVPANRHWKLYCHITKDITNMSVVADGIKFTIYDAPFLYDQLCRTPPTQKWHIVSKRHLSNGIVKRLWINSSTTSYWVDIEI